MSSYAQSSVGRALGQVSDLPKFFRRTGPRPLFNALNQPSTHRVSLDVACNALIFAIAAHPVVIGLILPEGLASVAKNEIRLPGTRTFDGSGYLAQRFVRLQQNVHVVGHHYPDEEIAQLPLLPSCEQCVDNNSGDARICQPHRARARQVQFPVERRETFAHGCRNNCRTQITHARQRAIKPPCQENWDTFRVPMRQSTAIEADGKTVVTRLDNSHHGRSETCPTL